MKEWMKEWELSKRVIPWINDHVIISNPIGGHYNVHGVVTNFDKIGSSEYYQVNYIYKGVSHTAQIWIDGNVIGESIEIDVQYYRDLKLKELGI